MAQMDKTLFLVLLNSLGQDTQEDRVSLGTVRRAGRHRWLTDDNALLVDRNYDSVV